MPLAIHSIVYIPGLGGQLRLFCVSVNGVWDAKIPSGGNVMVDGHVAGRTWSIGTFNCLLFMSSPCLRDCPCWDENRPECASVEDQSDTKLGTQKGHGANNPGHTNKLMRVIVILVSQTGPAHWIELSKPDIILVTSYL